MDSLAVYFAEDDVDTAEDDDGISDGVAEAHFLEQGEINQRRRANAVPVGIG
jgi:hypothetical protein